jgi:hypothetical protein
MSVTPGTLDGSPGHPVLAIIGTSQGFFHLKILRDCRRMLPRSQGCFAGNLEPTTTVSSRLLEASFQNSLINPVRTLGLRPRITSDRQTAFIPDSVLSIGGTDPHPPHHISQKQSELQEVTSLIASLRSQLLAAEQRRSIIQNELASYAACHAAIRNIPHELLCVIFSFVGGD